MVHRLLLSWKTVLRIICRYIRLLAGSTGAIFHLSMAWPWCVAQDTTLTSTGQQDTALGLGLVLRYSCYAVQLKLKLKLKEKHCPHRH